MDKQTVPHNLLFTLYQEPNKVSALSNSEWSTLISQLRLTELAASFTKLLQRHQQYEALPPAIKCHLESALIVAQANARTVHNEAALLEKALIQLNISCIMLKGSAYILNKNGASHGRILNDIDILIKKSNIGRLEAHLKWLGWGASHHNDYDERFYRQWMHEIPPMRHLKRGTVLDIHHSITPITSRIRTLSTLLFNHKAALDDYHQLYTFTPEVMVIHSATHLFLESEFHHGTRDIIDIHYLLLDLSSQQWAALFQKAEQLTLQRPLYYAITMAKIIMNTPIPGKVQSEINKHAPSIIINKTMLKLLYLVLQPNHPAARQSMTRFAHAILYLRGHYLRMPLRLLIPHLIRKSWRRQQYMER